MKGIVVDVKKDKCVILQDDGTFSEIKNRGYIKGQEISLKKNMPLKKMFAAAACVVLVCAASLTAHHLYYTPVSYVYIDVNPSFRLDINCFDKVISVVALNDDAKLILEEEKLHADNTEGYIEDIITACNEYDYINPENTDVEINIMTNQTKLEDEVQTASDILEKNDLTVSVIAMEEEENDYALKRGKSPRHIRAVKEYTETFGGTFEENEKILADYSSDDIFEETRKHRINEGEHRNRAIEEYTGVFGGTFEENEASLSELTTQEIRKMTNEHLREEARLEREEKKEEKREEKQDKREEKQKDKNEAKNPSETKQEDKSPEPQPESSETMHPDTDLPPDASADMSFEDESYENSSDTEEKRINEGEHRNRAIDEYTEVFGGTFEENEASLSGFTTQEIRKMTNEYLREQKRIEREYEREEKRAEKQAAREEKQEAKEKK